MHAAPIVLLLNVLLLLASGCAGQATADPGDDSNDGNPDTASTEKLIASPPPDWKAVTRMNNRSTRISEFIPPGQSVDEWDTRLSFQSQLADDLPFDPVTLLMSEAEEAENRCNFVQQFNVHTGYENNYETSVRLLLCGENESTGQGEVNLIKAIRGEQYIYSIRLERRIPPFDPGEHNFPDEEIAIWSGFLSRIQVCDDTPEHPCP